MELSEGGDDFLSIYVTEPEEAWQGKQVISPIRVPPQTPPPTHVPSPVLSLQSAQIPAPEVKEPEEPAENTTGFDGRTGEWVAGIVPPPRPLPFRLFL